MGMQVGGGGKDDLNSEINVTPFVDVMLVLLVIFMITTPMMNAGVDLTLPQTNAQSIESVADKLILSVDRNRKVVFDNKETTWVELEDAMKRKLATDPKVQKDREIYIQADQDLPYGVVVTAMSMAKQVGLSKVMLLTEQTDQLNVGELDRPAGTAGDPGGNP